MAELSELRQQIDGIDARIFELFSERTQVAEEVAAYKRENGMRVFDPSRERAKVAAATEAAPKDLETYAQVLMELLMEASRSRQHALLGDASDDRTLARINAARAATPAQVRLEHFSAQIRGIALDRFRQDSVSARRNVFVYRRIPTFNADVFVNNSLLFRGHILTFVCG